MKRPKPSKLEMQVLSVLWQRGPSTVREVLDAMPDGKERAYTTVLSVMQVMEKKGLLSHTAQGNAHVYQPRVSREKAAGPVLRDMIRNIFGGTAGALQHLLQEEAISQEELAEIKKIIATHEHGQGTSEATKKKK